MQKKEHLSEEGLAKIKRIKEKLNKTTIEPPTFALPCCRTRQGVEKLNSNYSYKTNISSPNLYVVNTQPITLACVRTPTATIGLRAGGKTDKSVFQLGLNNEITTTNLILILEDLATRPSIYKEVYKILKSKPKLLKNLYGTENFLFREHSLLRSTTIGEVEKDIRLDPCPYLGQGWGYEVQKNLEELIVNIKN